MDASSSYSEVEEIVHSGTHALGALLSAAGLALLVSNANGALAVTACAVYGATLLLMFSASTLYHAVPAHRTRAKRILQRLDHCCIYLLIAGTYTPFTLLANDVSLGLGIFAAIWSLAMLGIVLKLTPFVRSHWPAVVLYVLMGWLVALAGRPLLAGLSANARTLLLAGGLSYTVGVGFYLLERLRFHHVIWHAWVIAGGVLHFLAVWCVV